MHKRKIITPIAVGAAALRLAVVTATPASAKTHAPFSLKGLGGVTAKHATAGSSAATVTTLTDQVYGPFHVAVSGGQVLVADGFVGQVEKVEADGSVTPVASAQYPGGDVAGVATGGGALAYTGGDGQNGHQTLTIRRPGHADVVADISAFENANNPDKHSFYGTWSKDPCVTQALEAAQVPVAYHGVKDSHAYSVAYAGHGSWYVGDAAGNAILKVNAKGDVSLVAVLPAQPTKITKAMASALGLPDCVAGITYRFEPVPTDLKVSNGHIYVSLLPGGPEDPSLGARGSVYRMTTGGKHLTKIAGGLLGATGVAVGGGHVYVSQLFGGEVDKIVNGHLVPVASLPGPLGLAYANGALYAGVIAQTDDQGNVTAPGAVVRIDLH